MKIKVQDERVFPTLGIVATPGQTVDVPTEDENASTTKPSKGMTKDGDTDGTSAE